MVYNSNVDTFQDIEYPMLQGKTYLDHGGATIYAKSLIESVAHDLISNLYGNPHSASDPAHLSGLKVDETREKTLRFFGADPEHFDLVFLQNATAAIKLVMESFKDLGESTRSQGEEGGFRYFYHADSHNSLVGVREAADPLLHYCFRTDEEVEEWLSGAGTHASMKSSKLGLFAYPGQSNMTGRRLPLSWSEKLRRSAHESHRDIYTLLDAAALATTYPLNNLFANPATAPDFTALSFYKIFGYPDLGGLIVRKSSGNILRWGRKYFGGGTVEGVTVLGAKPWFESRKEIHSSLEDGTLPFHNIIALSKAIDCHEKLYGSDPMTTISQHANFLAKRLYDAMSSLVHSNGVPVCKIYNSGPANYGNSSLQGSTISFNIRRPDGSYIPYTSMVEKLANERKIYVRAGTLCNPGGIATNLGYKSWQVQRLYQDGHKCGSGDSGSEIVNGKPTGVVRVSLGAMTTLKNIDTMVEFLRDEFLQVDVLQAPALHSSHQAVDTGGMEEQRSFRGRIQQRNMSETSFEYIPTRSQHQSHTALFPQIYSLASPRSESQSHSRSESRTPMTPPRSRSRPPAIARAHTGHSSSTDLSVTGPSQQIYHITPLPPKSLVPPVHMISDGVLEDLDVNSKSLYSYSEREVKETGLKKFWKGRGRRESAV